MVCPFSPYSRGWSPTGRGFEPTTRILPVFAGMVPATLTQPNQILYSPRIRGDGPAEFVDFLGVGIFSPYSRGWSRIHLNAGRADVILPVFAGMVPRNRGVKWPWPHSPRIRGDGPWSTTRANLAGSFSPYSRGWSRSKRDAEYAESILPVFAGMVPPQLSGVSNRDDSPRIRGDGPRIDLVQLSTNAFSPYSRGWSPSASLTALPADILPVFAGMVPPASPKSTRKLHSPRIRGDGPSMGLWVKQREGFSPYSRGWSCVVC